MEKLAGIYCENGVGGFLGTQPINTLTNIAFLIAGFLLIVLYKRSNIKSVGIIIMICLVFSVGIGSTIWHYSGTSIGKILDIVPITLLALTYFFLFFKKVWRIPVPYIIIILVLFLGLNPLCVRIFKEEPLRTSAGYFPILLMFAIQAFYTYRKNLKIYVETALAFLTFGLAITFRSVDYAVCSTIPFGTHFLWHILNGFLVYFIVRVMIKFEQAPGIGDGDNHN